MEAYLTLMFGCIGYAEIAFSILPGGVSEDVRYFADIRMVPSIADQIKKKSSLLLHLTK